jgi:hypothetical protein
VSCSGSTSCSSFVAFGSAPITITSTDSTASTTLLSDSNSWSGLNRFTNASSSIFSAYTAFFGGTATSTFDTTGRLTLAYSSSTAYSSFVNSSTTNASIGNLSLPSLSSGGLAVFGGVVSSGATTTAGTGLTYSGNAFNVNTTQNITALSNLTNNGVAYTSNGNGTLNTVATTSLSTNGSLSVTGTLGALLGGSASTLSLNLGNANSWTALQTFAFSSTTYGSFTTASTTNLTLGGQTFTSLLGSGLTNTGGALTLDSTFLNNSVNSFIAASTTIPKTYTANTFTALNTFSNTSTTLASFTYASTTSLFAGNITLSTTTAGLLRTDANGITFVDTTNYSTFAFPFTPNTGYNSTTTTLGLLNGFFSTASSTQSGNFFLPSLTQGFAYTGSNGQVQTVSTSTIASYILPFTSYGASTSTTLGLTGGLFSTASSTFSGPLRLPSLSQGVAYIGSTGLVGTTATTTVSCSGSTSCSSFVAFGSAPITITSTDSTASTTLLSDSNSWSGLNRFTNASSSIFSAYTAFFGGTATSTFDTTGRLTLAYSSSTAYSSFVNSSTTNASIGTLSLPSLSNGGLAVFGGVVSSGATTTAGTGLTYSGNAFNVNTTQNITALSNLTNNGVAYTSNGNGTLNTVATTSLSTNGSLSVTGTLGALLGGSASTLSLNLGNANSWTALQTFAFSSTTYGSFTTASTTNLTLGGQTFTSLLGSGLTNTGGALTLDSTFLNNSVNSFIAASTTIPKTYTANTFTALNTFSNTSTTLASFTYASTTRLNVGSGQGYGFVGSDGLFAVVSTSTLASQVFSATTFAPNSIITTNSAGNLIATGTQLTVGNILATTTATSQFNGRVGLSTTTPWAQLSINPTAANGSAPAFAIGSSTATNFVVTNAGNVGIGTANPGSVGMYVLRDGYQIARFESSGVTNTDADVSIISGPGSAGRANLTFVSTNTLGWSLQNENADNGGAFQIIPGTINDASVVDILPSGRVGIGTTTPVATLAVNSVAGRNFSFWVGSTTNPWMTVANTGFGTTTVRGLTVNGLATSTSNVGFNITNGCYAVGGTCLTSFTNTIANGGTGSTSFAPNSIITSNFDGSALIATGTQLTVGNLLATSTTATSTLAGGLTVGGTNLVVDRANGRVGIGTNASVGRLSVLAGGADTSTLVLDQGGLDIQGIQFSSTGSGFSDAYVQLVGSNTLGWQATLEPYLDNNSNFTLGSAGRRWRSIRIGTGASQFDGSLTVGGSTNINNILTVTGQTTLDQASTTLLSANYAQFGATGTTTIDSFGRIIGAYSSSTAYSSFNTASTTNLFAGNITLSTTTAGLLRTNANGITYVDTTAYSTFAFPFTSNTGYNSTTTTLGLLNGFFSTASSTQSGNFFLPSLTQGFAYTGSNGLVQTVSSSTLASQVFSAQTFAPNSIITTNSAGNLIATGTQLTVGNLIATTTASSYFTGNLGVGSSTPSHKLSVQGTPTGSDSTKNLLGIISTSATYGVNLIAGQDSISKNIAFGYFGSGEAAFQSLQPNTAYVTAGSGASALAINTQGSQPITFNTDNWIERMRITNSGLIGIGTTTPSIVANLSISSTTAAQLSLSAGTGLPQLTLRNTGSSFYISTTTVAGTSTSTSAALEIALGGFGTTTVRGLNISGQATSTSNVGFNITGGCYAIGGTCLSLASLGGSTFPFTSVAGYNSTSTVIGFTGGLFSTASSTFSGTLNLPSLSNGGLAVFGGVVSSGATTTAGTGLTYSGNAFNVNTTQNITALSNLTNNGVAYTSNGNGTLNTVATTSLSTNGSLTVTGTLGALLGGSNSTLSLNLGNANSWTALQTFAFSSTTYGSFTTASTTNLTLGGQNIHISTRFWSNKHRRSTYTRLYIPKQLS